MHVIVIAILHVTAIAIIMSIIKPIFGMRVIIIIWMIMMNDEFQMRRAVHLPIVHLLR